MHCTKISPDFECQGQRSKLQGTKDEKVRHFVLESSSGVRSYSAAFFIGSGPGGAATLVGKSAHAV